MLRRLYTEDVVRSLLGVAETVEQLEAEWKLLEDDRRILRQVFPTGESKVVLPCNLHRMIWNAQKIFRINTRTTTDLHPLKVIKGCIHCQTLVLLYLFLDICTLPLLSLPLPLL